jgi:hypothetical protein
VEDIYIYNKKKRRKRDSNLWRKSRRITVTMYRKDRINGLVTKYS